MLTKIISYHNSVSQNSAVDRELALTLYFGKIFRGSYENTY